MFLTNKTCNRIDLQEQQATNGHGERREVSVCRDSRRFFWRLKVVELPRCSAGRIYDMYIYKYSI